MKYITINRRYIFYFLSKEKKKMKMILNLNFQKIIISFLYIIKMLNYIKIKYILFKTKDTTEKNPKGNRYYFEYLIDLINISFHLIIKEKHFL